MELEKQLTPSQALKEIERLKFFFIGTKSELHDEIDRIIAKTKKKRGN